MTASTRRPPPVAPRGGGGFASAPPPPPVTTAAASSSGDVPAAPTAARPTEAQLRWAQFHHKRRAGAVRAYVERLHRTPEDPPEGGRDDDDDAGDGSDDDDGEDGPSDGRGSCCSSSSASRDGRRPPVSRGRRWLLKRSKRRYRRRRREALLHGYRGFEDDDDGNGNDGDNVEGGEARGEEKKKKARTRTKDGNVDAGNAASDDEEEVDDDDDDDDQALDEIFMARPKRRQRLHRKGNGGGESHRRFQAACHAMMMNIKTTSRNAAAPLPTATKRWTRSEQHIAAAASLDRDFLDYKWGIRRRNRDDHPSARASPFLLSAYYGQSMKPLDGGASWMSHLPKHVQYFRDSPYYHDAADLPPGSVTSSAAAGGGGSEGNNSASTLAMRTPGPKKFHQLVAFVQRRLIEREREEAERQQKQQQRRTDGDDPGPRQPTMRLRQSHRAASPEDEEGARKTSRTRQIAESLEANGRIVGSSTVGSSTNSSNSNKSSRIREMARSLEGGDTIPTMKLRDDFAGSRPTAHDESPGEKKRRRSRYVPRMRLREFTESFSNDGDGSDGPHGPDESGPAGNPPRMRLVEKFEAAEDERRGTGNAAAAVPPPKMRLRKFQPGDGTGDDAGDSHSDDDGGGGGGGGEAVRGTTKTISKSLEPDSTPRMKLRRGVFDLDEKKVSEDEPGNDGPPVPSRTSVLRLSKHFLPQTHEEEQEQNPHRQQQYMVPGGPMEPSPSASSAVDSDFFAEIRGQVSPSHTDKSADLEPRADGLEYRYQGTGPSDPNKDPDDIFAQLRIGNQQQQKEPPTEPLPAFRGLHPAESQVSSPGKESDAMSDHSRGSNLSGLWNRGRNSINALTSSLNTITETQTKRGAELLSPEMKKRASNVSGRVSGFLSKLRTNEESSGDDGHEMPQQYSATPMQQLQDGHARQAEHSRLSDLLPSQSQDSHEALDAYRKKRQSMEPHGDDKSVASSFHPVPDQIRDAVHNSRASTSLVPDRDRGTAPAMGGTHTSPPRSTTTRSTMSELSSEKCRQAHGRVLKNSALLGDYDRDFVIDTDETQSDASGTGIDPTVLASLMMSPDILQKRLGQAIRAVEQRKWDQVSYLINANPWLVEMKELTTNQYLLHKLAFFGGGAVPAPESLTDRVIEKFPAAVHKFDQDGNVPLHLAAAAGNIRLIQTLGEKFESGASIRNEDGMLPLHFAIASYAELDGRQEAKDNQDAGSSPVKVVEMVLRFFPKAVAIADNDGNLPLHVAAECLSGEVGVDVIYVLMDEAERQLQDPFGARFHHKVKLEDIVNEDMSIVSMSTDREGDSSIFENDCSSFILNNFNETPLLSAIRAHKGWEMVEAVLSGPGGRRAALYLDAEKNNALHLLVGEFQDPAAAMSILKVAPEAATIRNTEGILPIEVACMNMMPDEVILAIAFVDLPINIEDPDGTRVDESHGGSWTFLTCESDDHFVGIVQEIVSICTFHQLRELCFMKDNGTESTIIARSSPRCREVLNNSLRFLGRFEFVGSGPLRADPDVGLKVFDALDFGGNKSDEGKRVLLESYASEDAFETRVSSLLRVLLSIIFSHLS